ncbi:hypothetical protein FB480_103452 [Agrobacterium vitis]|nr:hypothetical protein FB480_103452 [Agrobacterium vitis]
MSAFSAMHAVAAGTIHSVHGEPFLHIPMAKPADTGMASALDASRPHDRTFMGIFHVEDVKSLAPHAYDPKAQHRPGINAPRQTITIPAGTDIVVRTDDYLMRVADGVKFRVSNADPNELGSIIATVNS